MLRQEDGVTIYIGEYYVTTDGETVTTTLGSCVAVCLYDDVRQVGGMNHYLLKTELNDRTAENDCVFGNTSYGDIALPTLLDTMLKKGAKKTTLKAKIFGGGHALLQSSAIAQAVAQGNIEIARTFLAEHKIPIISEDVGGKTGRQIRFNTKTFKVSVKALNR